MIDKHDHTKAGRHNGNYTFTKYHLYNTSRSLGNVFTNSGKYVSASPKKPPKDGPTTLFTNI